MSNGKTNRPGRVRLEVKAITSASNSAGKAMKLKATRPLFGDYGRVSAGATFETTDSTGQQLVARGLAVAIAEPVKADPAPEAPKPRRGRKAA